MSFEIPSHARLRILALGALAALAFPACASDRETVVASVPAGMGMAPPPMAASDDAPKMAKAPLGYPWATNGPSLPTASANAPGRVIR